MTKWKDSIFRRRNFKQRTVWIWAYRRLKHRFTPTFPLISKTNTPDIDIFEFLQVTVTLNTQKLASTIKFQSSVNNFFSRNRFPASPKDITVARVDGEVANKTKRGGVCKIKACSFLYSYLILEDLSNECYLNLLFC